MVVVAAVLTSLVGWLVLGCWRRPSGVVEGLSFGFAAGAGVISLQMLAYSLLRVPWHPVVILLPWAALAAWRWRASVPLWQRPEKLRWIECLAVAAMLAAPVLWLPYERLMPLSSRGWDAWAIWLFKAKAFAADGGVKMFLERAGEFNAQPSYPLLVPLYGAFLLKLGGTDQAAKAISPLFFVALLGAFYSLAGRFASRPVALVFTAMLANLHMVNITAFELAGYADTTLSVYLLLGAGFLYAWYREDRAEDLVLAAGFAGLAAWTKNEGIYFVAAVGVLVVARRPRAWRVVAVVGAVTVLPWMVLRQVYGVPGSDLWTGRLNWANLWPGLLSFGKAFDLGRYNLTFWLLAVGVALYRRVELDHRWLVLPGLVVWQLGGLLGAYLAGRNELQWWIGTSLDRVLAQVAPLALLGAAVVAGAVQEPAPAPVVVKAPGPKSGGRKRR
jgi:hypothetical protein